MPAGKVAFVVAVDVSDAGVVPLFSEKFLDDGIGRRIPQPSASQFPTVHDVADEVEVATFILPQEVEKQFRLRVARAQVHVGDPDGSVVHAAWVGGRGAGLPAGPMCTPAASIRLKWQLVPLRHFDVAVAIATGLSQVGQGSDAVRRIGRVGLGFGAGDAASLSHR